MKIRYTGPAQSVSLPVDEGPDLLFSAGETVDVPDDLGAALVSQGTFEQVTEGKKSK